MNIATLVARVLLGLIFLAAGISGFLMVNNPPPAPPGLAGAFQNVFFESRWVLFVDAVELVAGVLLLANRFVPLALVALAGVIYNIAAFHITLAPSGIIAPFVLAALWLVIALPLRAHFAPLLVAKTAPARERARRLEAVAA